MGFRWNLRKLMAEQGMFAISDLVLPGAEDADVGSVRGADVETH
jgi:hypothetical protein